VVDATLIAALRSTKTAEGERDPEMHRARKGQQQWDGRLRPKWHQRAQVEVPGNDLNREGRPS
jgi:hypothetical protein